jgi:hypothetical protein
MITHRHFVSRSTGDDLSTISSAWPNWAVSPLFSPTTTLVYWVDSLPPDTDSQISPARTPPKAIDSDFPRVRLLLASITDLAGYFHLAAESSPPPPFLPPSRQQHNLAWTPGIHPAGHIFVRYPAPSVSHIALFNIWPSSHNILFL